MRRFAKLAGPPCVAGIAAVTFPSLTPYVGGPLLIAALALTAYGYWDDIAADFWFSKNINKKMSLAETAKHLTFNSYWAYNSPLKSDHETKIMLEDELYRHLLSGDLAASADTTDFTWKLLSSGKVSTETWESAKHQVEHLIFCRETDQEQNIVVLDTKGMFLRNIKVNRAEVLKIWPNADKKTQKSKINPLRQWALRIWDENHKRLSSIFAAAERSKLE